jgi:hypothetical protein
MDNTNIPIFIFKKVEDKWKTEINPKFAVYMKTTHGMPFEILEETINNWDKAKILQRQAYDWKNFADENNIGLDPEEEGKKLAEQFPEQYELFIRNIWKQPA